MCLCKHGFAGEKVQLQCTGSVWRPSGSVESQASQGQNARQPLHISSCPQQGLWIHPQGAVVARAGLGLVHEVGGAFAIQVLHLQQDRCYLPVPQGHQSQTVFHWRQVCTYQRTDWEMDMNVGRKGRQGGSCNLSGKGKLFHAHGKTWFGKAVRPTGSCRRKDNLKGAGCL